MNQAQAGNHEQHIGWINIQIFFKPTEIGKSDIADTQRDHRINQEVIDLNTIKGSEEEVVLYPRVYALMYLTISLN